MCCLCYSALLYVVVYAQLCSPPCTSTSLSLPSSAELEAFFKIYVYAKEQNTQIVIHSAPTKIKRDRIIISDVIQTSLISAIHEHRKQKTLYKVLLTPSIITSI